jgi:hypothetical protein
MLVSILLGSLFMARLLSSTPLKIYEEAPKTRMFYTIVIPLVLFFGIVWIDSRGVFPRYLNLEFPHSLLFYPSIAYVVEIIFHILPLSLCVRHQRCVQTM